MLWIWWDQKSLIYYELLKWQKKYLGNNAQMGCFTAPAVFSEHCSFWLLIVLKDVARFGKSRFTSFAENWLQNWIASKDKSFFRDGIRRLPERWEKVVGSDGQYFNWSVHSFCFEIKKRTELICTPNNTQNMQQSILSVCTYLIYCISYLIYHYLVWNAIAMTKSMFSM